MTVQDLIDILSDLNPDAEVRLAQQPRNPLEFGLGRIVETDDGDFVYLGEGRQFGYLRSGIKDEIWY